MQSLASFGTFILLFFFASGAYVVWSVEGGKQGNGSNTSLSEKHTVPKAYDATTDHRLYDRELDNKTRALSDTQAKLVETEISLKQAKKELSKAEGAITQLRKELDDTKAQFRDSLEVLMYIRNSYYAVYTELDELKKEYLAIERIAEAQAEKIKELQPQADRAITAETRLRNWQIGTALLIVFLCLIALILRLKKPDARNDSKDTTNKKEQMGARGA